MADAQGDIIRTFAVLIIKGLCKTNDAEVVGNMVAYDTDGWASATNAHEGPFGVCMTAITITSGQVAMEIMVKGAVRVFKKTGAAIENGQGVMASSTAGAVMAFTIADVGATPSQASINASLLDAATRMGTCIKDAASGAAIVDIVLL